MASAGLVRISNRSGRSEKPEEVLGGIGESIGLCKQPGGTSTEGAARHGGRGHVSVVRGPS
jgi:hypothetical protein